MEASDEGRVLDELVVLVAPSVPGKAALEKLLDGHGAALARRLTAKVTHVCTTPTDTSAMVVKARKDGKLVVRKDYFNACVKAGQVLDGTLTEAVREAQGLVDDHEVKAPQIDSEDDSEPAPVGRKRAAPRRSARTKAVTKHDSDDDEPPPKRARKAAAPKAKVTTTGPTTRVVSAPDYSDDDTGTDEWCTPTKASNVVTKMVVRKSSVPVDSDAVMLVSQGHVLEDADGVWSCVLNQTNIKNNANKFYNIQLVAADMGEQYWVFTKWGRVGKKGQNQTQRYTVAAQAKRDFEKKFYEKTRNMWAERAAFTPVKDNYTLIEIDYGDEVPVQTEKKTRKGKADSDDKPLPECSLDERVQELVKLICNVSTMQATMVEMDYDLDRMPLGKLKKTTLEKAAAVLGDLEHAISTGQGDLVELSNQFYTLVPHYFGMKPPPVIRDLRVVRRKAEMLEELGYIEVATKLLQSAGDSKDVHPIEREYRLLKTDITPVEVDEDVYALIERYVKTTHATTHNAYSLRIKHIFRVERQDEVDRFEAEFGHVSNHQLLWHGSRVTNFMGILSQGLRIAPPEAPCTGYMFGKGIYFADMVSKSANYCHTSRSSPTGLALLCQTALGTPHAFVQAQSHLCEAPAGYDSTWGVGQTAPNAAKAVPLPEDPRCIVPMGPATKAKHKDAQLLYNEYIVYKTSQTRLRYLVMLHFEHR